MWDSVFAFPFQWRKRIKGCLWIALGLRGLGSPYSSSHFDALFLEMANLRYSAFSLNHPRLPYDWTIHGFGERCRNLHVKDGNTMVSCQTSLKPCPKFMLICGVQLLSLWIGFWCSHKTQTGVVFHQNWPFCSWCLTKSLSVRLDGSKIKKVFFAAVFMRFPKTAITCAAPPADPRVWSPEFQPFCNLEKQH